jgi:rubrerythrin
MDDKNKSDIPRDAEEPVQSEAKVASDDVALDMALKRENFSIKFYEALLALVEKESAKALLHHLIEEEKRHFSLLSDALVRGGYEKIGVPKGRESLEMTDYLIRKEIKSSSGPEELMRLAIRREEAAEEFYLSRINYIQDKKLKDLYQRLADEEGNHRKTLLSGYDDLMIMDIT